MFCFVFTTSIFVVTHITVHNLWKCAPLSVSSRRALCSSLEIKVLRGHLRVNMSQKNWKNKNHLKGCIKIRTSLFRGNIFSNLRKTMKNSRPEEWLCLWSASQWHAESNILMHLGFPHWNCHLLSMYACAFIFFFFLETVIK